MVTDLEYFYLCLMFRLTVISDVYWTVHHCDN